MWNVLTDIAIQAIPRDAKNGILLVAIRAIVGVNWGLAEGVGDRQGLESLETAINRMLK